MGTESKRLQMAVRSATRRVQSAGYSPCLVKRRASQSATLEAFWRKWGERLKVNTSDFRLVRKDQFSSSLGKHFFFQQMRAKHGVSRAWFRVDLNGGGDVVGFSNRCLTNSFRASDVDQVRITAQEAVSALPSLLNKYRPKIEKVELRREPRQTWFRDGNRLRVCWKIEFSLPHPREKFAAYVDANKPRLRLVESLVQGISGRGLVFVPNPMTATGIANLKAGAAVPLSAYRDVELLDLDGHGFLDGAFVSTRRTSGRKPRPNSDYRQFTMGDPRFHEVMAYYHIDTAQRYVRSIIKSDRLPQQVVVNARTTSYVESAYDFQENVLHLFEAGPRDGEDADVILHEYGHALHGAIAPGFGATSNSRPLSEGFADYFAASRLDGDKPVAFRPGIASWHARAKGKAGSPPFLRRLDYTGGFSKQSPRLIEVWASCLWDIRKILGARRTDTMAIAALHLFNPHLSTGDTFFQAGWNLRRANNQIIDGAKDGSDKVLVEILKRHKINA